MAGVMRQMHSYCLRIFLITCFLALAGCSSLTPAGFWKSYRKENVVSKFSDQGPWGGTRIIHWKSNILGDFKEEDATAFAEKNGWRYVSRSVITAQELSRDWVGWKGQLVFPLFYGFDTGFVNNLEYPRVITEDCIVIKYDSRWMREDAGTNEMSVAYGYVMISHDGKKMSMYHLWGNS
jgi:hypothetical protein